LILPQDDGAARQRDRRRVSRSGHFQECRDILRTSAFRAARHCSLGIAKMIDNV
jgi:hypothetical protein